jgi:hypothetical protein
VLRGFSDVTAVQVVAALPHAKSRCSESGTKSKLPRRIFVSHGPGLVGSYLVTTRRAGAYLLGLPNRFLSVHAPRRRHRSGQRVCPDLLPYLVTQVAIGIESLQKREFFGLEVVSTIPLDSVGGRVWTA